jgi:hypothetical protein
MTVISFQKRRIRGFRRKIPRKRLGMKTKSYLPRRIITVSKGKPSLYKLRSGRIRLFKWKAQDPTQYMRNFIFPRHLGIRNPYTRARNPWAKKGVPKKKKPTGRVKRFTPKQTSSFLDEKRRWDRYWKSRNWRKQVERWQNDPRIGPKRKKIFIGGHASGYAQNQNTRWGRDPWGGPRARNLRRDFERRVQLGPAGSYDPVIIFDIRPHKINLERYIKQFTKSKNTKIGHTMVRRDVERLIERAKTYIIDKAQKYIGTYVPKDTGILRHTMLNSLRKSKPFGYILRMELDTGDLQYAKPVNNMPTKMLQHDMKNGVRSRGWINDRGKLVKNRIHPGFNRLGYRNAPGSFVEMPLPTQEYKHDPKAIKGWWGFSVMSIRQFAREAYNRLINDLVSYFTVLIRAWNGLPIPKTEYFDMKKLQMGLDMVKQLHNYKKINLKWTWDDEKHHYDRIKEYLEPEATGTTSARKRAINRRLKGISRKGSRARGKSVADTPPDPMAKGITYYFPQYIRPILEDDEEWIEKAKDSARNKSNDMIMYQQDIEDEQDRARALRLAKVRGRMYRTEIKQIVRPTRLEIKKLFKVRFK